MLRTMSVEDNISFRKMFRESLLSEFPSMEVIEASNGKEAFKWLASYSFDLVFMDIKLPGENGLSLTRKIKAKYKDVMIAMLTSYDLPEYREAAAQCGVGCFIAKESMRWGQISTMIKCFHTAKDGGGLKPGCLRLGAAANSGVHWLNT